MKKLFVITFLIGSIAAVQNVSAQDNAVKVNILSPVVRTLNLSYERVINENSSFQLGFYYSGAGWGDFKYRGFGITPEYRFYLSESEAPEGFYVAPFLRYQSLTLEYTPDGSEATLSGFGGGAVVGKQWLFSERVTLDIFLGPSFTSRNLEVDAASADDFENIPGFGNFGLRSGVTLGIAF